MTAIALTIAGSDSGGGAGIQADLKTFSALGVYGASVITAVTAQNTRAITHLEPLSLASVTAQIRAVFDDLPPQAVKIGMLGTPELIKTVAGTLKSYPPAPIVLDPVMVAKSGDSLLAKDAIAALKSELIPIAALITPNLPEAAALLEEPAARADEATARRLLDLGAQAVLLKDGHGDKPVITDILCTPAGVTRYENSRIHTKNTHGTGCTLSSAITAGLAKGLDLPKAAEQAERYLAGAIAQADTLAIGTGHGPVHHFHSFWPA